MLHPVANLLAFQLGWFAGVVGAAAGWPLLGALYTGLWLALHLRACAAARGVEARLLLSAAVLGFAADSALVLGGLIAFPEHARLAAPTTLWMVALWVNLAATLRHGLGWLRRRAGLAALLGAVAGPLAYLAGSRLGAITLVKPELATAAIALEWALSLPLLSALAVFLGRRVGLTPSLAERETAQMRDAGDGGR